MHGHSIAVPNPICQRSIHWDTQIGAISACTRRARANPPYEAQGKDAKKAEKTSDTEGAQDKADQRGSVGDTEGSRKTLKIK